ncbi:hypothetical protein DOY81_014501 [Sarcophaga bullata]|nr:hypothetical protein DOY81_014501 [Sarcophaga bullata]
MPQKKNKQITIKEHNTFLNKLYKIKHLQQMFIIVYFLNFLMEKIKEKT